MNNYINRLADSITGKDNRVDTTPPSPSKSKSTPSQRSTPRPTNAVNRKKTTKPGKSRSTLVPSEFSLEHVNEEHVTDFLRALSCDPLNSNHDSGPEHISASSELMPLSKKTKNKVEGGSPNGLSHTLLKYPFIVSTGFTVFGH